ncbi:hypothetical protein ACIO3O_14070 [Streptomyces sp. NPDC087440]|uniref:hypothetical protein n=1 Tax=Streptomyces sp. NPDC087440 TaxID=3365790 RepID=UPI00380E6A9A
MIRTSTRPAAVAVLAVGLLALTACGTLRADAGAGPTPPGVDSSLTSASPTAPDLVASARAAHDKAFPDVAARCKGVIGGSPTAGPGTPDPLPTDPEAAKYAENHAFKQQKRLTPEARCRGEAHAQRIRKALTGPGAPAPANEADLTSALARLGYPADSGSVYRAGDTLGFSYFVPETGPCVTGRLGTPATVTAHGAYLEGGCTEPRGGH